MEQAIRLLITADGELPSRLYTAYERQLRHIGPGDLPAELAQKLRSIQLSIGLIMGNESLASVQGHIMQLSSSEAAKVALQLFELSCSISQGLYH